MSEQEIGRLSINLPKALKKEFEVACVKADTDMTTVVIKLVQQWVEKRRLQ
jgi:hypothetical protein